MADTKTKWPAGFVQVLTDALCVIDPYLVKVYRGISISDLQEWTPDTLLTLILSIGLRDTIREDLVSHLLRPDEGLRASERWYLKRWICQEHLWKTQQRDMHILLECMRDYNHPKWYYKIPEYLNWCLYNCRENDPLPEQIFRFAPFVLMEQPAIISVPSEELLRRWCYHIYLAGATVPVSGFGLDFNGDRMRLRISMHRALKFIMRPQRSVPYQEWIRSVVVDLKFLIIFTMLIIRQRHPDDVLGKQLMDQCVGTLAPHIR